MLSKSGASGNYSSVGMGEGGEGVTNKAEGKFHLQWLVHKPSPMSHRRVVPVALPAALSEQRALLIPEDSSISNFSIAMWWYYLAKAISPPGE
jgi:hypothetical protein